MKRIVLVPLLAMWLATLFVLHLATSQAMIMVHSGFSSAAVSVSPPAYDSKGAASTGTGNLSWTHTPVGTPRGILVFISQTGAGDDQVSGVTYGGVAMTEVTGSPNLKASGEAMAVYAYFLGSSIPTGAQTVVATVSGSASKRSFSVSLTSDGDTEITDVDATLNSGSVSNPSATLSLGGVASFAAIGFMSGHDTTGACVKLANWANRYYSDFGTEVGGLDTYDPVDVTDVTIGHTQAAEDYAAIGVAIKTSGVAPPTDGTAPYVNNFSPPNGQTSVLQGTTSAVFHVLDDGDGVDNTTIQVTRTGGVLQTCGDNLVCTGGVGDITVTYSGLSLSYDDNVAFQIGASDTVPNAMDNVSYWFTVQSDPGAGGTLLVGDNTEGGSGTYIQSTGNYTYTSSYTASVSGTATTAWIYYHATDATNCKVDLYAAGDTGVSLDSVVVPVSGTGWKSGTLTGAVSISAGTAYRLGYTCNAWQRIRRDSSGSYNYCASGSYTSPPNPNCKTGSGTPGGINVYITN